MMRLAVLAIGAAALTGALGFSPEFSLGSTPRRLLMPRASMGCGANIQAVYEGDVRFEHCMALDANPSGRLSIRRACWGEWLSFYTYGQTRDRVVHAQERVKALSVEVDRRPPQ